MSPTAVCLCFLFFFVSYSVQIDINSNRNQNLIIKDRDDGKSSLVFVFDTTGSMFNDLRQLRESAEMILNTALEESNIIADFVFVPFHDPGVGPATVTRHKGVFKAALNLVRVYGGGDCPEKSLSGIALALNVSRPRSFVYVFTDATAGDHRLVGKVLDAVQRKQSQVVFVLTGHCNDLKKPSYLVYEQIAAASGGQVFNLNKTNVHKVFDFVRSSIKGRNVNLGSEFLPAGYNHTQGIPVDSTVAEVTVSVSGSKPQIKVIDPSGEQLTGPPKLVTTLDLAEIMIVKVMQPEPGNWTITVGSERDYSVKVVGLSNLTFDHGFSVSMPASAEETSHRPLKSTYNHMLLSLSQVDAPVSIDYAEVLSLAGKTLFELPLKRIDKERHLYLADPFIPPDDFFYVAINGHDNDNNELRRVGATAVQAKLPDIPYLTTPRKLEAHLHEKVVLKCGVESLVPITAYWTKGNNKIEPQISSLQSTSIEFMIEDMSEADEGGYKCVAKNIAGVATADTYIHLEVEPPQVELSPVNQSLPAGDFLRLSCGVRSDTRLFNMQLIFHRFHRDNVSSLPSVIDIVVSPNEDGVYVYNKTVDKASELDSGVYTCVAVNRAGRATQSTSVTVLSEPIVQILGPHIIKKPIHSAVQLMCQVDNAEMVQWAAPNGTVVMEAKVNGSYTGMFEVKNITEEGAWTCFGSRGSHKAKDIVNIDILIKPIVYIEGDRNVTLLNGTSRDITCIVTARPTPRIIWHRETESFLNHKITHLEHNTYKSVLSLNSSVELVEATYFCIGENSEGIAEGSVLVRVRRLMKLSEGFTDKAVEIYSQVELHCQVDSYPAPRITWYHNSTSLVPNQSVQVSSDNTTVYVPMVDFDNLGDYACVADNGYEKVIVNGTLTITGLEAPVLSKEPSKNITQKGESVILTCRVRQGKPEPTLSWKYKNKSSDTFADLPQGVVLDYDQAELKISVVSIDHYGVYRCVAHNIVGMDTYDVELVVQYPPQLIGSTGESSHQEGPLEIKVGGKVHFSCKATGIPKPVVIWTKDGRSIVYTNNVYLSENNDLIVEKASQYDSGLFTCHAISPLGSSEKNFTLLIYELPHIEASGLETNVEAIEGQLVELPCRVRGVPSPRAIWMHGNQPLSSHRKYIDEFGIRFVANITDFGNYTCLVTNDYGNASISYSLFVWVSPSVVPVESSKSVLVGSNATLQCDAVGFPIPVISWEFQEEILTENNTDLSFNDSGNLFISNVSSKHEGTYACIADNIAGSSKKEIRLNINDPPKIQEPDISGPYIATNVDTELTISCKVTGRPKPYVAWIKDGYYIDNDTKHVLDFDGSLTIISPSEENNGDYTCVAKNAVGEANRTIPVEIYSAPTHIQSEETHSKVSVVEGRKADIECPVLAAAKDVVKWYKDAKLISEGHLRIQNVSISNASSYTCVVSNYAGAAVANVRLAVEYMPRFDEQHVNTDLEIVAGDDIYFDCAFTADPKAKVKWFLNSKLMLFEDKDRLKLLSVQLRNSGVYKCVVSNEHGTVSREFTLDVLVPPFISEFDVLDVDLQEGTNASLQCNAKGEPKPVIKWTSNNTNWHVEGSKAMINNITVSSESWFRCVAANKAGAAHLTYRLNVIAKPKIQEITMFSQGEASDVAKRAEIVQDTHVRISCKASGQPNPKVQWIRNGHVLSENSVDIAYADLIIDDVRPTHAGVYACIASNEGGVDQHMLRIDVLEPPKIFQSLFQNNTATSNTVNLEILSGQAFFLHCHPYGNPMPAVYWFKDDLPLRFFDDSMVSSDYGEVIESNKALQEQSGNYTCVARNKIGNTSLIYLVDVLVPPPVPKESTKVTTTRIGRLLNLTCPAEGSPIPNVMWIKHPYMEIGEQTPRVILLNDNITLLINNTEVSDSGKYTCIMTNKVGTTEASFDVTIEMPPTITGQDEVENHVVPLMKSVVLKCEVKGHPQPEVTWLKDTQQVQGEQVHIQNVLGSSLLAVWRAGVRAAGQYTCVATSRAGHAARRHTVAVQVPGKWSGWSTWDYCNVTCGAGFQHRTRFCRYVDNDNTTYDKTTKSDKVVLDVRECKGPEVDKRKCNMPPCEEVGVARWSAWGRWGACSATCGAATQVRTRRCRTAQPCYGDNVQIRKCPNLPKCAISAEKRDVDATPISKEQSTEIDSYSPEATYELQPEVVNSNNVPDVEEVYLNTAGSSLPAFYDVKVTSNLDFSEHGPCEPGFTYNEGSNSCDDIDECNIPDNQCHSTQACSNTKGGYRCGCLPGYASLGPGQRCLDINECEQETDGCEYACVNVAGGHVCACPRPLRLRRDRRHCHPPSTYREPYSVEDFDTSDYLSASIELPAKEFKYSKS